MAVEEAGAFARRARGHPARPRRGDHRSSRSRRSASAPGPTATARCSCCTTCSGSTSLDAAVREALRRAARRGDRGRRGVRRRGEGRRLPDDDHAFHDAGRRRRRDGRSTSPRDAGLDGQRRARGPTRRARADDGCAARRSPGAGRRGATPRRRVVVSIFVNPMQFDRRDDFDRYPRPIDDDVAACARAGVDAVYAPTAGDDVPGGLPDPRRAGHARRRRSGARCGPATSAA